MSLYEMRGNCMDTSVGNNAVWGLVLQSDFISKMVLLLLFGMSVLSWAVALYKFILFRIKKYQCQKVLQELKSCSTLAEATVIIKAHHETLPGYVLIQLLTAIKQADQLKSMDFVQSQIDQILDEVMHVEESYVPVLSIIAAVATLMGLFGTVWGLVHSFIRISEKQSADIVTVAPGIAEALITTVAGLMVAIPALIFFHFVKMNMNELEFKLVMLTDKVTNLYRLSMIQPAQKETVDTFTNVKDQHPLI